MRGMTAATRVVSLTWQLHSTLSGKKKAIPSLLSVGNWPLEAYLARYFAVSLL